LLGSSDHRKPSAKQRKQAAETSSQTRDIFLLLSGTALFAARPWPKLPADTASHRFTTSTKTCPDQFGDASAEQLSLAALKGCNANLKLISVGYARPAAPSPALAACDCAAATRRTPIDAARGIPPGPEHAPVVASAPTSFFSASAFHWNTGLSLKPQTLALLCPNFAGVYRAPRA
jgi:hypothetical protein